MTHDMIKNSFKLQCVQVWQKIILLMYNIKYIEFVICDILISASTVSQLWGTSLLTKLSVSYPLINIYWHTVPKTLSVGPAEHWIGLTTTCSEAWDTWSLQKDKVIQDILCSCSLFQSNNAWYHNLQLWLRTTVVSIVSMGLEGLLFSVYCGHKFNFP